MSEPTTSAPAAADLSRLELNVGDEVILGLDVSASMGHNDAPGGKRRIDYCKEQFAVWIEQANAVDPSGVTLITFGVNVTVYDDVTTDKANSVLARADAKEGGTETHLMIEAAWGIHKKRGAKQTFCLIVTDGAPGDTAAVKRSIAKITQEMGDEHEFAIGLYTVGVVNDELRKFLDDLDDEPSKWGAKFDIVDVKPFEGLSLAQAVSGALHD